MEIGQTITIRVRSIANGYTASVAKSGDYRSKETEPHYYATFGEIEDAAARLLASACNLELPVDSDPDF